jgi:hypothetical protein
MVLLSLADDVHHGAGLLKGGRQTLQMDQNSFQPPSGKKGERTEVSQSDLVPGGDWNSEGLGPSQLAIGVSEKISPN